MLGLWLELGLGFVQSGQGDKRADHPTQQASAPKTATILSSIQPLHFHMQTRMGLNYIHPTHVDDITYSHIGSHSDLHNSEVQLKLTSNFVPCGLNPHPSPCPYWILNPYPDRRQMTIIIIWSYILSHT